MGVIRRGLGFGYKITALSGAMYGAYHGLHQNLYRGANAVTNGTLDDIVRWFGPLQPVAQTAAELIPYALITYALMQVVGNRIAGSKRQPAAPHR